MTTYGKSKGPVAAVSAALSRRGGSLLCCLVRFLLTFSVLHRFQLVVVLVGSICALLVSYILLMSTASGKIVQISDLKLLPVQDFAQSSSINTATTDTTAPSISTKLDLLIRDRDAPWNFLTKFNTTFLVERAKRLRAEATLMKEGQTRMAANEKKAESQWQYGNEQNSTFLYPIHFLSYGPNIWNATRERVFLQAQRSGIFRSIHVFGEDDIPFHDFPKHLREIYNLKRGGGYWLWKFPLLEEALTRIPENEYFFYLDSGSTMLSSGKDALMSWLSELDKSGKDIIRFGQSKGPISTAEHNRAVDRLFQAFNVKCTGPNAQKHICDTPQFYGGALIGKSNSGAREMMANVYDAFSADPWLITDAYNNETKARRPDFVENRHDQAFLSISSKVQQNYLLKPVPTTNPNDFDLFYQDSRIFRFSRIRVGANPEAFSFWKKQCIPGNPKHDEYCDQLALRIKQQRVDEGSFQAFIAAYSPHPLPDSNQGPWDIVAPSIVVKYLPFWIQRYIDFHNQSIPTSRNVTTDKIKYIVYRNTKVKKWSKGKCHDGIGKQQTTIMATFLLAILTNRVFLIDDKDVVSLSSIFQPHLVRWNAMPPYIRALPRKSFDFHEEILGGRGKPHDFAYKSEIQVLQVQTDNPSALQTIWKSLMQRYPAKVNLEGEPLEYQDTYQKAMFYALFRPTPALLDIVFQHRQASVSGVGVGVDTRLFPFSVVGHKLSLWCFQRVEKLLCTTSEEQLEVKALLPPVGERETSRYRSPPATSEPIQTGEGGTNNRGPWHSIAPILDEAAIPIWIQRYVDFHKESLAANHSKTSDTNNYLVYTCKKPKGCSGTGNRHRVIFATFLVALLTDRIFLIDIDNPLPLHSILQPHLVMWNAIPSYLDELPSEFLNALNDKRHLPVLSTPENFTVHRKPQVVRILANSPNQLLTIWQSPLMKERLASVGLNTPEATKYPPTLKKSIFYALFRPTPVLTRTVHAEQEILGLVGSDGLLQPYTAIHVRAGGDWPGKEESRYKVTELKPFYDEAIRLSPLNPIVVVSDNAMAKTAMYNMDPIQVRIVKNISLVHIDRSKGDQMTVQAAANIWADILLLAQSECIVLSTGSFSKLAFHISEPSEARNSTRCHGLVMPPRCSDSSFRSKRRLSCTSPP